MQIVSLSESVAQCDEIDLFGGAAADNKKLSPLLLYRDKTNSKLIVADGYHRLCAVYTFDEDAMIPCKIV